MGKRSLPFMWQVTGNPKEKISQREVNFSITWRSHFNVPITVQKITFEPVMVLCDYFYKPKPKNPWHLISKTLANLKISEYMGKC
jgi:hypothetical protein